MELEIQTEQVFERFSRDLANCTLANVCKYGIKKFTGKGCSDTRRAICSKGYIAFQRL
jgi:hypothetical protein